jgi:hypothetical protein
MTNQMCERKRTLSKRRRQGYKIPIAGCELLQDKYINLINNWIGRARIAAPGEAEFIVPMQQQVRPDVIHWIVDEADKYPKDNAVKIKSARI